VWIDGFVISRHPVTVGEYIAFLNALVERGCADEAAQHCPRVASSIDGRDSARRFQRDAHGRYISSDDPGLPQTCVRWDSAVRLAAWRAKRDGIAWRLPSELEREKAARGVDGRALPWGDHMEPTWACMVGSTAGAPQLATIDNYATDESVYGARGLAGNVRDWCAERWTPRGPRLEHNVLQIEMASADDDALRSVRGGAWMAAPPLCRSAGRYAAAPRDHFAGVGIRLVASDLSPGLTLL
jgi:serine/threonine-protein kinase